jgi:multiple sugar transport system permease protein
MSYGFVALYAVLTVAFGILPAVYALYLAFTTGDGRFAGFGNFTKVVGDFRFLPAVGHVALYLVIWLVALVVLVSFLAIVVHAVRVRWLSRALRLVFYLPGALAGASSVLLWLFVLDPTASPVGALLRLMGFSSFVQVIVPGHLPVIFAIIAFWTGAGGWIVIMYGALNNISNEVIEAARMDGASGAQIAWRIQLPLMQVDFVHGHHVAGRRHAAVRRAAVAVAGQQRGRTQRLLAQPARVPVRVPAERLQRGGGDLAPAARYRPRAVRRVRDARRPVREGLSS